MNIMEQEQIPGPYTIVAATSFGVFLSALDSSIVNVSLFTMATSLGVTITEIQWVVLSYLLVITSMMPVMGKLGDKYGKKKVFQLGMILFIMGSFFCAISADLIILVTSRIFQAIGASMLTATGLALVTYFTTSENRGRAIGMNSIVLAAALGLGPVLGGILSEFYGWPSIFLVNLPVGVIGLFIVEKLVPRTNKIKETKFDNIGAFLFLVFLLVLIYYVSIATSAFLIETIILVGITVFSFIALIFREKRFSSPIIPTGVMADRRISASIFSAFFAYIGIVPVTFLIPFYLQEALGYSQSITGLFLMAHPVTISIVGPLAGYVSERIRARTQTVIGLLIEAIGLILLGLSIPNIPLMLGSIVVMGFGISFFSVSNGNFIMTAAPKQYMGVVSALINISRTTGFSVGIAAVTATFTYLMLLFNPGNIGSGPAFVQAYSTSVQSAIWLFSAFVLVAMFISAFRGLCYAEGGTAVMGGETSCYHDNETDTIIEIS